MLTHGNLVGRTSGALVARRDTVTHSLGEAIDRASKGDKALGIAGIGVPLLGVDGERAAAFVLPIGVSDMRMMVGKGHAAVFIGKRQEQQPLAIEILRTLFNLSQAEARIVMLSANGDAPTAIAQALGISIATVRSHLSNAFAKTGTKDRSRLVALVNQLLPPVA
jgi:DNA-binding CsgD family transcriptional regulator